MKIGDVVELKSGGPKMTVEKLFTPGAHETAGCVWFEGSTHKSANFVAETLRPYKEPDFSGIA